MRTFCLATLLAFAVPAFAATPTVDLKAATFQQAIATANDALELHNAVAERAGAMLSRSKPGDKSRRDAELLSVVLGSYSIYYKQYGTILQELDRLEKKPAPTVMDDANRAEFWRKLSANRDNLHQASLKVAKLAKQMGIQPPVKWDLAK